MATNLGGAATEKFYTHVYSLSGIHPGRIIFGPSTWCVHFCNMWLEKLGLIVLLTHSPTEFPADIGLCERSRMPLTNRL